MKELAILNQQLPVIEINFEEIKQELSEQLQGYKGLVVTDESLSLCKTQQKSLAGLRTKIDTYRKDIKKSMSEPIVAFEDKCKQLISLVEEAEKPLKDGIQVFDDKKREEKTNTALAIIKETIQKHGLNEEYAAQLTVIDKYRNLTATAKEVREDIEQRAFILIGQQQKDEEMLELIKDAINTVNKGIKTQLDISEFSNLIKMKVATKDIIAEVNKRAEKIRLAEMPKPEPHPEPVVVNQPEPQTVKQEQPVIGPGVDEDIYFVEIRVTETKEGIALLGQYLREQGYKYTVLNKGRVE